MSRYSESYLDSDDEDLLISIHTSYRPFMIGVAQPILQDRMLAEDVVSEIICDLITRIERCRDLTDTQLTAYLYVITRNRALKYLRDWVRGNSLISLDVLGDDALADDTQIEDEVAEKLDYEELMGLIERQDPQSAQLLRLRAIYQYSFEEISSMLAISNAAARNRYYRVRHRTMLYLQGR